MSNDEKAKEITEQLKFSENLSPIVNDRIYDAAIKGMEWKQQQFIEKSIKWFRYADEHNEDICSIDDFIVKFKKAMEE